MSWYYVYPEHTPDCTGMMGGKESLIRFWKLNATLTVDIFISETNTVW